MSKIAVLMSTYNGERYISEQIDSILRQKVDGHIDLWVRDDGSLDKTQSILREYSKSNKLNWYTGENLGPAKSFIDMLSHCGDYDYYAFSDQDDVWNDNKIAAAIKYLNSHEEPAIYCSNAELVDKNLNTLNQYCNKFIPQYNLAGVLIGGGIQGATMVFNRALALEIVRRKIPEFISMHDYYISVVCLSVGGNIIYDANSYMKYRQHENNVIGVDKRIGSTIKNRIAIILNENKFFDIEKTSKQIVEMYRDQIPQKELEVLQCAMNYKHNLSSRIQLALYKGIGLGRLNMSLAERLSVLLGKV
jgi:glycosyltransferase involved in cell wall biosynthesis